MENTAHDIEHTVQHKPKKHRKMHPIVRMLTSFLLVLFLLEIVFLFFATPILRTTIQRIIFTKSEGVYTVDFDSLSLDLGRRSFHLFGFRFTPDTALYNKLSENDEVKTALYDIKFDKLSIEGLKIVKLYQRRQLIFNEFKIVHPQIRLLGLPKAKKDDAEKYDAINEDLYPSLLRYLNLVQVNKVSIQHGEFDFRKNPQSGKQTSSINNISVVLNSFYLTGELFLHGQKLFYSESVAIDVQGYNMLLNNDKQHLIADSIHIDSKLGEIFTFNTSIHSVDSLSEDGSFKIHIPTFKITGIDINQAFYQKKVNLSSIEISDAYIRIVPSLNPRKDTSNFSASSLILYPLVSKNLEEVVIDTFKLSNANMQVVNISSPDKPAFLLENLNISLSNFLLDSVSHLNVNKIMYSDDIELTVANFQTYLNKSNTHLKARNLYASTKADKIKFEQVSYVSENRKKFIHISAIMPYAYMQGINLHSVYHTGILPVENLILQDGKIVINRYEDTTLVTEKKFVTQRNESELMNRFMQKIQVSNVQLLNTSYHYTMHKRNTRDLHSHGNIEVTLTGLQVFPAGKKAFDDYVYLDDIKLNFNNFYFKSPNNPHYFQVGGLYISTSDSILRIRNLKMSPDTLFSSLQLLHDYRKSSLTSLMVDTIEFRNFNLANAWFDKKLKADDIFINQARVKIDYYPQLRKMFKNEDLLNTEFLTSDTGIVALVDTSMQVIADAQEILFPADTLPGILEEAIAADTSVLQLRDLAIFKMLYNFTDEVNIKITMLNEARLMLVQKDTLGNNISLSSNTLKLKLSGLKFNMFQPVDSVRNSKRLFLSDNLEVDFDNYEFDLPDKIHVLKVGKLKINTLARELSLYNAGLYPKRIPDTLNTKNYYTIKVPAVKVWGIDFRELAVNKKLLVDSVVLPVTQVEWLSPITLADRKKKAVNPFDKPIPKFLRMAQIGTIRFGEILLNRQTRTLGANIPSMRANLSLIATQFYVDSASWHTYADVLPFADLRVEANDFRFHIKDSLHTVNVDYLRYTSANKFLTGNGLRYSFMNDSSIAFRLHKYKKAATINLQAPIFAFEGIDMNQYYRKKNVDMEYLLLENANLEYTSYPEIRKQYGLDTIQSDLYQKFKRNLNSITAKDIEFSNLDIKYQIVRTADSLNNGTKEYVFNNANGNWKNFKLDSIDRTIDKYNVFKEDVTLQTSNVDFPLRNPDFKLKLGELKVKLSDSSIQIRNLTYMPVLNYHAFVSEKAFAPSYFKIRVQNTLLKGIQWNLLLSSKQFVTRRADVDGLWYYTYRDRKYPTDTTMEKPMLFGMLKALKTPFSIDSLNMSNSSIQMEEMKEEGLVPGTLSITRMSGNGQYITNIEEYTEKKRPLRLSFEAYLMDRARMKGNVRVPNLADNSPFTLAGSIDSFSLDVLNPYLENTANMSIRSGKVESGRFIIDGNDSIATGTMRLRYHNLKVNLMKAKRDSSLDNRSLTSFLANTIIPTANPRKGRLILREGYVYAERNKKKSVFTFWVDAILSGIKSTLGFESKMAKKHRKSLIKAEKEMSK